MKIEDFSDIKIDGRNIGSIEWNGDTVMLMLEQTEDETSHDGWQIANYYPECGDLITYETTIILPDGSDGRIEESKLSEEGKKICQEVISAFLDADIMSWDDGEIEEFPTLRSLMYDAMDSILRLYLGLKECITSETSKGRYKLFNKVKPDDGMTEEQIDMQKRLAKEFNEFVYDEDKDDIVVYSENGETCSSLGDITPVGLFFIAQMIDRNQFAKKPLKKNE